MSSLKTRRRGGERGSWSLDAWTDARRNTREGRRRKRGVKREGWRDQRVKTVKRESAMEGEREADDEWVDDWMKTMTGMEKLEESAKTKERLVERQIVAH